MAPLNQEQREIIRLLEQTYRQQRSWPPWQFVEEMMDRAGVDALAVMSTMPQVGRKQGIYGLSYGLTWSHGMVGGVVYQPGDPIGLTVVGFHQAGAQDIVGIFLHVLDLACRKLATFTPNSQKVVAVELTSEEVRHELAGDEGELPELAAQELYELLQHEPATWTGSRGMSPDGEWRWEISRAMRPYCSAHTIEGYVDAVTRAAEESAAQVAQMVPSSAQVPYLAAEQSLEADLLSSTEAEMPSGHEVFFAPRVPLLGSAIDADLWEYVRPLVEAGRWEQVAREAAAFVETRTREWTGSRREVLDLMQDLLAPQTRRGVSDRETATERGEQEGWHLLARGFILAIRNHVMHNSVGTEEELQYGLGGLGTASLLVRRIRTVLDERRVEESTSRHEEPAPQSATRPLSDQGEEVG